MKRSSSRAHAGRTASVAFALHLIAICTGCQLFTDLDRFSQAPESDGGGPEVDGGDPAGDGGGDGDDLGCSDRRTLCVRVEDFSPHVDELVAVDLVTVADNILRARAIVAPLGAIDADIVMPLAIPASEVPDEGADHPLHLELFADQDKNGEYTPGGADHEWNVDLPDTGNLVFRHNSEFTAIDPRPRGIGADFRMAFRDMAPHIGQSLEVMVIERSSGRTVGLYRMTDVPSADFELTIPGIIDPGGVVYKIEFYADANGNGRYDDPPEDHTWTEEFVESGEDGIDFVFEHGTNFEPLGYQFPFEL